MMSLTMRFAGLDVTDPRLVSIYGNDGIKCVNWLTLVDDVHLAKLGGRERVLGELAAPVVAHPLENGLVVQAGEVPRLGDVKKPDELQDYRAVAKVVRPIFSKTLNHLDWLYTDEGREHDYTPAWRRRFFPGAKWP